VKRGRRIPGLEQIPSSNFFRQKTPLLDPRTELRQKLRVAQIDSQSKHTKPRRENRKNRHENEILKANEHAPQGAVTPDQSNDNKKHTSKSRVTTRYPFNTKMRHNVSKKLIIFLMVIKKLTYTATLQI
jgi:hypothetical protein